MNDRNDEFGEDIFDDAAIPHYAQVSFFNFEGLKNESIAQKTNLFFVGDPFCRWVSIIY